MDIALVGIDNELEKLWRLVNHQKSKVKRVFAPPTGGLSAIVTRCGIHAPVTPYVEMPEFLEREFYDYILVSDINKTVGKEGRLVQEITSLGFPEARIMDFSSWDMAEFLSLYNVMKYQTTYETGISFFVTGVSHAYAGTDIQAFSCKGVNLALTSQDLFLDYLLAKKMLKNRNDNLKSVIIGVAPFSLHYDLSLSVNKHRMLSYYPLLKNLHNYHISEEILSEILGKEYFDRYDSFYSDITYPHRMGCNTFNKQVNLDDYMTIRQSLRNWDRKYYSETANENKKIIKDYVNDCLAENVIPILVIYPVSEWYNRFFSPVLFDEVKTYLGELSYSCQVQYYDFSADGRFDGGDFFDVEHLNIKGAKKISSILNDCLYRAGNAHF